MGQMDYVSSHTSIHQRELGTTPSKQLDRKSLENYSSPARQFGNLATYPEVVAPCSAKLLHPSVCGIVRGLGQKIRRQGVERWPIEQGGAVRMISGFLWSSK